MVMSFLPTVNLFERSRFSSCPISTTTFKSSSKRVSKTSDRMNVLTVECITASYSIAFVFNVKKVSVTTPRTVEGTFYVYTREVQIECT